MTGKKNNLEITQMFIFCKMDKIHFGIFIQWKYYSAIKMYELQLHLIKDEFSEHNIGLQKQIIAEYI